jgi:hypothetical protein
LKNGLRKVEEEMEQGQERIEAKTDSIGVYTHSNRRYEPNPWEKAASARIDQREQNLHRKMGNFSLIL